MPQAIQKFKIFLASPSDLNDERLAMSEVISELNLSYGARAGVVMELLKWETHAAPGISNTDSQKVIENDLGNDYDLFIGILWKKFGTPTSNFESGTEQEFKNAYSKFTSNPQALNILFYFKISGTSNINDIDPIQFLKVIEFKKSLGEKAVLFWEYDTLDNLKNFLRIHIPKRIDDLLSFYNKSNLEASITLNEINLEVREDELGLIDFQEIYEERMADAEKALLRLAASTKWIGEEIGKKTAELNDLSAKKKQLSKIEIRDFCRRTAEVMNGFANRIASDIVLYIQNFEEGCNAFSKVLSIHKADFREFTQGEIELNTQVLSVLLNIFPTTIYQTKGFLNSISQMPRMAKELNQARNNVETKLLDLINKLEVSHSLTNELLKNVR